MLSSTCIVFLASCGDVAVTRKWLADWETARGCMFASPEYGPDSETAYAISSMLKSNDCPNERLQLILLPDEDRPSIPDWDGLRQDLDAVVGRGGGVIASGIDRIDTRARLREFVKLPRLPRVRLNVAQLGQGKRIEREADEVYAIPKIDSSFECRERGGRWRKGPTDQELLRITASHKRVLAVPGAFHQIEDCRQNSALLSQIGAPSHLVVCRGDECKRVHEMPHHFENAATFLDDGTWLYAAANGPVVGVWQENAEPTFYRLAQPGTLVKVRVMEGTVNLVLIVDGAFQLVPLPVSSRAVVDAVPRLPLHRESFWNMLVGDEPAELGPDMQAWCAGTGKEPRRSRVTKVVELVRDRDSCSLLVWAEESDPLRRELRAFLARWNGSKWDRAGGSWIDEREQWSAEISDGKGLFAVYWHRHVKLEDLIGTSGKLLKDLDVESLVGAPTTALRKVVRPPFRLERCDAISCTATGPSAPGGARTEVYSVNNGATKSVGVRVHATDTHRVRRLIAQSVGLSSSVARVADRDETRRSWDGHWQGNNRYKVSVEGRSVTVLLQRVTHAMYFEDPNLPPESTMPSKSP